MIFYFFLRFHENRMILSCFHRRYEFCMQKYPSKWISIEDTISANFIKGYSLAIQPIFSKILKFLILLYCLLFHLKIIFDDFLWQSAQEFQWKSQTINKNEWFFIIFCVFMKTVGFCPVFIADMNSACKNTLVSVYLLNFYIRHNFV